MMKRLFNEFVKNIRIIFRNWVSLSLLVIAPIVMILLIGYAFSSEDLSGITVGVVSKEKIDLSLLTSNFSSSTSIVEFEDINNCIEEMVLQRVHLCISLEGINFEKGVGEQPSGKVTYYYDNSRKRVSLMVIQGFQEFFGEKAEQISIESAESIIGDIEDLVAFINDRKVDIQNLKNESSSVRKDLVDRGDKLRLARDSLLPPYESVKFLQDKLDNYSFSLDNASAGLNYNTGQLIDSLEQFKNYSAPFMITSVNLSNETNISLNYSSLLVLVDVVEGQLLLYSGLVNSTISEINQSIATIDTIVAKMDLIKSILDEEIVRNDEYIVKIDSGLQKVEELSSQLDERMSDLAKLHPDIAKKLANPIVSDYSLLLKDAKSIQLSFPLLCVIIIMFIALLFANITTLMEIHNRAYLRNIVAPVNDLVYTLGLWLTSVVIIFFQILVLFVVAQTKFGVNVFPNFWQLSLITVLLISIFALLGMLLAYSFKSTQSSILMATFTAILFFLFGNTLSPLESMPLVARIFASYNPLLIGEFLIKEVQLFGTDFVLLLPQIYLLVMYVCVLLLAIIGLSKLRNARR